MTTSGVTVRGRTMIAAALFVVALAGCGKDAPMTGTVAVTGSGPDWQLASSMAETSNDGKDVLVTIKIKPVGDAGDTISPGIVGDLSFVDQDGALPDYCTIARASLQRWSSGDNDVNLRCPGSSVDIVKSIKVHEK